MYVTIAQYINALNQRTTELDWRLSAVAYDTLLNVMSSLPTSDTSLELIYTWRRASDAITHYERSKA